MVAYTPSFFFTFQRVALVFVKVKLYLKFCETPRFEALKRLNFNPFKSQQLSYSITEGVVLLNVLFSKAFWALILVYSEMTKSLLELVRLYISVPVFRLRSRRNYQFCSCNVQLSLGSHCIPDKFLMRFH